MHACYLVHANNSQYHISVVGNFHRVKNSFNGDFHLTSLPVCYSKPCLHVHFRGDQRLVHEN